MMVIETKGLTYTYPGATKPSISDVSIKIEKGECIGIVGRNGAGKTTLFNCIAGFYPPTAGNVQFKGEDITGLPPNEICLRGIARTFQIVRIFKDMSVLDNVMVGAFSRTNSAARAKQKALEVLDFCGLAAKKSLLAGGLTIADKKRLDFTKALATDPSLLMLDEAIAGLNQTETAEAVELVKKVRGSGITVLLVEHVMEVVMPISSRVVVLDYGKKIAEDTPEKVIHNEEVIKAYLGDKYHASRRAH